MATYCITAANHKNPSNHVASSFLVWLQDDQKNSWSKQGPKSAREVVSLVESGNTVLTARFDAKENAIYTGEPVEVELRIAKNKTSYDVSKMPTF